MLSSFNAGKQGEISNSRLPLADTTTSLQDAASKGKKELRKHIAHFMHKPELKESPESAINIQRSS